jgi:hypothetical protein
MFLHVTQAVYVADHRVTVSFSDGTTAELDLSGSLEGPIFAPLRDFAYFRQFSVVGHTLAWPNGADFAPEYLYSLARSHQEQNGGALSQSALPPPGDSGRA